MTYLFYILVTVFFLKSCAINDSSETENKYSIVATMSVIGQYSISSFQRNYSINSNLNISSSSMIATSSSSISINDLESTCEVYSRGLYASWYDEDKDCQDTRQEVLNSENTIGQVTDCKIVSGSWYDPYSDSIITNPSSLDIDHFIPLAEAHRSGAYSWTKEKRKLFSNSLERESDLIAVWNSQNRSKGDRDPSKWLPKNTKYHIDYVKTWIDIKVHWGLTSDKEELEAIKGVLGLDTLGLTFPPEMEEMNCKLAN